LDTLVQKQLPWAMWPSFVDLSSKNVGMLCNLHEFFCGHFGLKTGAVSEVAFLRGFIFQKGGMLCNFHPFLFGRPC
jgi:hypothetical protein